MTTLPDGWQLVPKAPTTQMLACFTGYTAEGLPPRLREILVQQWKRALAAAPTPSASVPVTDEQVEAAPATTHN